MTNVIHVGTPPPEHEPFETFTFHIHDFERIDATKNVSVELPPFSCFGHRWRLVLYPGGNSMAKEGKISIFLHNESEKDAGDISINFAVNARDVFGGIVPGSSSSLTSTFHTHTDFTDSWGFDDYLDREAIMRPTANVLRNGTLTLDLSMQRATNWKYPVHVPRNPFQKNMLRLHGDDDTADVSFEVRGERFLAHRAVLKYCAPTLFELCQSCDDRDDAVPLPDDLDPEVFRKLLRCVYGGTITSSDFEHRAWDFIDAADKYDVVNLKLEAEAEYVERIELTADNVAENLLYADAKHLALLKEKAADFLSENEEVLASSESLENELPERGVPLSGVLSPATENDEGACPRRKEDEEHQSSMSVNDLRWELSKRGLDVDGSREMLVARLERTSREQETTDGGRKRKIME